MNARHEAVDSPQAPRAIGPYSQAVISGDLLFCSGQIPLDPATGSLIEGDIGVQTERVLANLGAVLARAGAGFMNVVRTEVFLVDMEDFPGMNAVYERYFTAEPRPARVTVAVAALPRGARVEISCIARL